MIPYMIPNTMGDRIDLEAANVSEIQIGISPLYPPQTTLQTTLEKNHI